MGRSLSKGTKFQLCNMSKSQRSIVKHSAHSLKYCIVFAKRVKFMLDVLVTHTE